MALWAILSAESVPWRNFYLTCAQELRDGVAQPSTPNTASPVTVRAMTPEMVFDHLGVRLDSQAAGDADITLNVDLGDQGGQHVPKQQNGVRDSTANAEAEDAAATLTPSRATLNTVFPGETTVEKAISDGHVQIEGNADILGEFVSYLDTFEFWFNTVTP